MHRIMIPYETAKHYVEEADVLLFRGKGLIGKAICAYTRSEYSHVGLAHWDDEMLMCVEQREFKGGRSTDLQVQVYQNPDIIDVYRAEPHVCIPTITYSEDVNIDWKRHYLNTQTKKDITKTALKLTGTSYGWRTIWGIFKGYAPFLRLLRRQKNGDDKISKAYVCSTLATFAYRMNYIDLCPNLSDSRTTPADLARSSSLHYLFTLST